MRPFLLAIALLLACVAGGCGDQSAERSAIEAVLAARSRALNNRDLDACLAVVSPRFSSKGKDYGRLREELAAGFRRAGAIAYRSEVTRIAISGDRATVAARYEMRLTLDGRDTVLRGEEHLTLVREAGGWKITAGL